MQTKREVFFHFSDFSILFIIVFFYIVASAIDTWYPIQNIGCTTEEDCAMKEFCDESKKECELLEPFTNPATVPDEYIVHHVNYN